MKEKKSCRLTTEEAIATVSDKNPDFAKELLENYKALIRRRCNGCPSFGKAQQWGATKI